MVKSSKGFCVLWVGAHNIIKRTCGLFNDNKKNYDWVVRFVFLLMLKLQDIDNKSLRLLKLGILHALFDFVFWGFDGMDPSKVLVICKSLKFKD
jgi:hypothetical protein